MATSIKALQKSLDDKSLDPSRLSKEQRQIEVLEGRGMTEAKRLVE